MRTFLPPLILGAVAAASVILSGCDSAAARHPKRTQKVVLSAEHPNPDVAMEVIDAVEVVLPPGPAGTVGYAWEITSNNARVLEQMGALKPGPLGDAPGAPATTLSFFALKPGRSVLQFALVRPGEAEETPASKCAVTVRVSD
jgi:hypothetical protein